MLLVLKVLLGANLITKLCNGQRFDLGIVPYFVEKEHYGEDVIQKIQDVMKEIESQSCLKFVPLLDKEEAKSTNKKVLMIINENGVRECVHKPDASWSMLTLPLGFDCLAKDQIFRAILHGIGMKDEVTNPGRDQYVRVMWANIAPEYRPLYQLSSDYEPNNVEYDPRSVMHFHDRAYSVNGKPTLEPVISGLIIEPSEHLTQLDILRLHLLYNKECSSRDVQDLLQSCKNTLQNGPDANDDNPEELDDGAGDDEQGGNSDYPTVNGLNPDAGYDSRQAANPEDVAPDYNQGDNTNDAIVGASNSNFVDDYSQEGNPKGVMNGLDDSNQENPANEKKLYNNVDDGDVSISVSDYDADDDEYGTEIVH